MSLAVPPGTTGRTIDLTGAGDLTGGRSSDAAHDRAGALTIDLTTDRPSRPGTAAHLLMQADPGRAEEVAAYVSTLPGITETAVTSGPYDVIARLDLAASDLPRVLGLAKRAPGLSGVRVCRRR